MILLIVSAGFVVWFLFQIKQRYEHFQLFQRLNVPGPPPSFLWGNLSYILRVGYMKAQAEWHERYGPIVGHFFGHQPWFLIKDTQVLKNVLLRDFMSFIDRPEILSGGSGEAFKYSLIALKGQRWKEVRSKLTPSFTTSKLRQLFPEIGKIADEFMANVDAVYETESKTTDIYELYQAFTADSISRSALGVDFGVQKDIENSRILNYMKKIFTTGIPMIALPFLSFPFMMRFSGPLLERIVFALMHKGENPVDQTKKQCAEVVKMRRQNPAIRRADLLQLMLDAQSVDEDSAKGNVQDLIAGEDTEEKADEKSAKDSDANCPVNQAKGVPNSSGECPVKSKSLTDVEVIDNAMIVLIAGYETTSATLAFATRLLIRFPEIQDRLRKELMQATNGGTQFGTEAIQRCHYLDAVIQETLRMYPPIHSFVAREAAEEKRYPGVTIPKNSIVLVSTVALHHDAEIYPEPEQFKPERFLPENRTPEATFAWQPFGSGPRNCIGMRYAQMTLKITLAKLLTKYRLTIADTKLDSLGDPKITVMDLPTSQRIRDPLMVNVERV